MMPGGGRMNERSMRLAMRRMGMTTEELKDVEEVIIRTRKEEIIIGDPQVTVVSVQGMKTYQIAGDSETRPRASMTGMEKVAAPSEKLPEEDIELVMAQANVSRDDAINALKVAHGEPAEAIINLMSKRS